MILPPTTVVERYQVLRTSSVVTFSDTETPRITLKIATHPWDDFRSQTSNKNKGGTHNKHGVLWRKISTRSTQNQILSSSKRIPTRGRVLTSLREHWNEPNYFSPHELVLSACGKRIDSVQPEKNGISIQEEEEVLLHPFLFGRTEPPDRTGTNSRLFDVHGHYRRWMWTPICRGMCIRYRSYRFSWRDPGFCMDPNTFSR